MVDALAANPPSLFENGELSASQVESVIGRAVPAANNS
jgi:hypothetical protein